MAPLSASDLGAMSAVSLGNFTQEQGLNCASTLASLTTFLSPLLWASITALKMNITADSRLLLASATAAWAQSPKKRLEVAPRYCYDFEFFRENGVIRIMSKTRVGKV